MNDARNAAILTSNLGATSRAEQRTDTVRRLLAQDRNRTRRATLVVWCMRLAILALGIGSWELVSGTLIPTIFISEPTAVLDKLSQWIESGILLKHMRVTLLEALTGFALGTSTAVLLGLLVGRVVLLERIISPFLVALYGTPKLALAPIFILWFGIAFEMKTALVAVIVFFLVFYNTVEGVKSVPQPLINVVRIMGGNRQQVMRKIIIPSAAVWVFNGLRISVPYALSGAIVGEIVASSEGLGYLMQAAAGQLDSAGVYAALMVIMALAVAIHLLLELLRERFGSVYGNPQADLVV